VTRALFRIRAASALCVAAACLACEGGGSGGLVVKGVRTDPRCTPLANPVPSGLALVPGVPDEAVVVQIQPPALVRFELDGEAPVSRGAAALAPGNDTDGDGVDDADRSQQLLSLPLAAVTGEVNAVHARLALVSTSNYEGVIFTDPSVPAVRTAQVENPDDAPGFAPEDYPFLPPGGTQAARTAISTRTCVYPGAGAADSGGVAIAKDARCDAAEPTSYLTNLTHGATVAAGRLFAATSNLRNSGQARFYPGTVLVYDLEEAGGALRVRPHATSPVLRTTAFNPTGVMRHVTGSGRELVLVTVTGAIGAGTGTGNVHTRAAVDVIDPVALRIVASIPLGFSGAGFEGLAIDRAGRVGMLAATSRRELFGVDLRPLDDDRLYAGDGPPVLLDGLTAGFPDARIFDGDHPLVLPERGEGAPPAECRGFTHVAWSYDTTEVLATDFCDGDVSRVRVDLAGPPPVPVPRQQFQPFEIVGAFAPLGPGSVGLDRAPGPVRVRPGVPGADYAGPDVFTLINLPRGQLCALRIASPAPPAP
jgi:hypothetical protein